MRRFRQWAHSIMHRGAQALSARVDSDEKPRSGQDGAIRDFLQRLDVTGPSDRTYLDIHMERIASTLSLVPAPAGTGRALELGTYMHMAPALQCVLGYREVRGAYYGPSGRTDRRQAHVAGKVVFECTIDLFDAEKDRFPYDDGSFDCVLACEIVEHMLHDPMHLLFECWRVLVDGGALVVTTPNVVSATAVARVLEMSANPQLYSKYTDPRSPFAETEYGHMREYTPGELEAALFYAGFTIDRLFTANAPGYGAEVWVLDVLKRLHYPTAFRGEQMYCVARKNPSASRTRYPGFLYEV